MNNCTVKCCNVLLTTHLPTFLTNPNTDDFVVRSLSSNFSKILALHIEKPKFTALLVAQQDETILDLTFVQVRKIFSREFFFFTQSFSPIKFLFVLFSASSMCWF